jgi:hypothetical protein
MDVRYINNINNSIDIIKKIMGPPITSIGAGKYIEINLTENSWRPTWDFEWLHRNPPPLMLIEELVSYYRDKKINKIIS